MQTVLTIGAAVLIDPNGEGVANHFKGEIGTVVAEMSGSASRVDDLLPSGHCSLTPVPTYWVKLQNPVQPNGVGKHVETAPIPAAALTPLGS